MTFEEAFNSGCRFRFPKYVKDNITYWHDGFYWQKSTKIENGIQYFDRHELCHLHLDEIKLHIDHPWILADSLWYLHPHDAFNKKVEKILEE